MTRLRQCFVPKVVSAGVLAMMLLGSPLPLAAQEGEHARARAFALAWVTSVWSDLTSWLALDVDGRCAVDPDGCPGGMAPPTPPEAVVDGRCGLDPNGCPGGG